MSYLLGVKEAPAQKAPETLAIPHSSFLQAATYDAENFSLTLDFKNGMQSVHRFVFPIVWQQFKEAKSHGSFYANSLKGKYPTVNFREPLKVSDLTRAIKEHRPHAPNRKS
jgi:hypothetical protein